MIEERMAKAIRQHLRVQGVSLREAGKRWGGKSGAYVSALLSGTKKASLAQWEELARVVGCDLTGVLNVVDDENSVTVGPVKIIGTPEQLAALVPFLQDPMSLTRPAAAGEPWQGVVELLADAPLCETLGISAELRDVLAGGLSALPIGPATKAEAVAVAQALKLVTGRR